MATPPSTTAAGDEFVGPFPSWINVKTVYGAKGDGVTDDTAAFQRALTELGTAGHGDVLWIPAGTYKITSQMTLSNRIGVSVIGEDPATTILKWGGPGVFSTDSTAGSMFNINGVAYSKFDRLTFDGSGSPIVLVDQAWDGQSNYFDTGNEYADDYFVNANIGIRGGVLGAGFAETSILRDHFTNLKVIGVIPMSFNALDVWVRDSIFDHNTNGVGNWVGNPDGSTYINGAGNVGVYNSIFHNSTVADISLGNTATFAIRDNYSIGSGRFITGSANNSAANTTLQGNTILDTTDPTSIMGGNAGPYVMLDNFIRSKSTVTYGPVVWFSDFARDTDLAAIGNTFTVPNPMYTSGRLVDIDNSVVSPSTINAAEPTLPLTEPNMHRPVVEVAVGSSDIQIQQAINSAVAQYNGQRPVVHIPEGTYSLNNTIIIPANSDVQLVGDGMFASVLVYTGSGSGPTVQIQGPSHATLRDIGLNGSQKVDALVATGIDQPGSHVFISQAHLGGAKNANLFFDGLDYTTVDAEGVTYNDERGGADIRVVGGPLAAAGNPQGGELRIFSGAGGGDQTYTSNIDVSNGGTLLSRDVWFDGGQPPYLRVTQGTVTIDNGHVWLNQTDYPQSAPAIDLSNLNGKVTLLNTDIGNSTVISGDGTNAKVLALAVLRDQPAPTGSYFYNNASPDAMAGLLNSRQWSTLSDRQTDPTPDQGTIDSTFVKSMIEQARGDHAPILTPIADGVTDLRVYRVNVEFGTNNILLAPGPIATAPTPIATTVIESFGSTSLVQLGNNYFLYPVGGSSGPELSSSGAPVDAGQLGSWTLLGAEQTASGYEVAWKDTGADQYSVWATDRNGSYISNTPVVAGTSSELQLLEPSFHQDLNGDGVIGPKGEMGPKTVIESAGSTSLVQLGNNYFLYPVDGSSGPELSYSGAPVDAGQLGSWTLLGAEQTASGYEVAWKDTGADQYSVWATDRNGSYISNTPVVAGTSSELQLLEPSFHQDLNGDGVIGPKGEIGPKTVIESAGSTSLVQLGNNYFLYPVGGSSGPELSSSGAPVDAGQLGSWTLLGAEQTASGYEVAWKDTGADQYSVWATDRNGSYISNTPVVAGTSSELQLLEPSFHQDLNGDGVIGPKGVIINGTAGNDTINAMRSVAGQPLPTNEEDTISSGADRDTIDARGGNDFIDGGSGSDTMKGGAGNDTYVVDNTGDRLFENANEGTDTVQSSVSFSLPTNIEHLTLAGPSNLNGTGNALGNLISGNDGRNVLTGLAGTDTLSAGAGRDTLIGGVDVDMLTGGSGSDRFVFTAVSDSTVAAPDTIVDFVHGEDVIDFLGIDANSSRRGDQAFAFGGENPSVVTNGVTWFQSGVNTVVQADVNGDANADLQIILAGIGHNLTATDFFF